MPSARERAKARQSARIKAAQVVTKHELTEQEIANLHFTGLLTPQQWIERMGDEQRGVAHLKLEARANGVRPTAKVPLSKEEVLVRELDKLDLHCRQGVVLQPRFNGLSPTHVPPPKPWEPFLPPITGNENNWQEWEEGGRVEAARNDWTCEHCLTVNRPLRRDVLPGPDAAALLGLQPERCELCTALRGAERDYTALLGLPKPERARQGMAPEPGQRSPCFCDVCEGYLEQERDAWREHYFDGMRWQVDDGQTKKKKRQHESGKLELEPVSPLGSPASARGCGAGGGGGGGDDMSAASSMVSSPVMLRPPTVQRFHIEERPVYEKDEFHMARWCSFRQERALPQQLGRPARPPCRSAEGVRGGRAGGRAHLPRGRLCRWPRRDFPPTTLPLLLPRAPPLPPPPPVILGVRSQAP